MAGLFCWVVNTMAKYKPTEFMAEDSRYDKKSADYAVNFIECLSHTKGTWAGKKFELLDWQEQIIRDLFGILKPNGYRQFNTAYIEIPKKNGNQLAFGSFGIKALETKWITGRQIEAARIAVTRYMQRQGQIWIRIFPDKPITRKPADVRMGKGKGAPEGFVAPVTPGRIITEAEAVSYEIAKEALRLAAQKLPITTKFVVRRDYDIQNQNA